MFARAVPVVFAFALGLTAGAPGASAQSISTNDVFRALVQIEAEIPSDARTARSLGRQRGASGVVIDGHGLVLTIGYIILEAMSATVTDADGKRVPADILAYDYDTGFGLLRALGPIGATPMRFGDSDSLAATDNVLVVGAGAPPAITPVFVAGRESFAGYWEYLLDEAIFTAPVHPDWAGTALVGSDGRLLGIGSLYIDDVAPDMRRLPGNMFVPINLLKPILGDLLEFGRSSGPARPWLGLFTRDVGGQVIVVWVIPDGPGHRAGVDTGDVIMRVAGAEVDDMEDLFRKVWALGDAGVDVPLTIKNDAGTRRIILRSGDRYDYLRLNPTY